MRPAVGWGQTEETHHGRQIPIGGTSRRTAAPPHQAQDDRRALRRRVPLPGGAADHTGDGRGDRPGPLVRGERQRPPVHPQADQDQRGPRRTTADLLCASPADTTGQVRAGPEAAVGSADRRRASSTTHPGRTDYGAADRPFPRLLPAYLWPGRGAGSGSFDVDGPGPAPAVAVSLDRGYGDVDVVDEHPRTISNLIVDQTTPTRRPAAAAELTSPGSTMRRGHAGSSSSPTTHRTRASRRRSTPGSRSSASSSTTASTWSTRAATAPSIVPLQHRRPAVRRPDGSPARNDIALAGLRPAADPRHASIGTDATTSGSTTTRRRRSSTRTRPTPRTPRTRCSCASTSSSTAGPSPHRAAARRRAERAGWPPGPTSRPRRATCSASSSTTWTCSTSRWCRPTRTASSSRARTATRSSSSGDRPVEGNPDARLAAGVRAHGTDHAFLDDIAHHASTPTGRAAGPTDAVPSTTSPDAGDDRPGRRYDDALLDEHFVTGDGRGNENIGLTAVHHVFHAEHNRLVGRRSTDTDPGERRRRWSAA